MPLLSQWKLQPLKGRWYETWWRKEGQRSRGGPTVSRLMSRLWYHESYDKGNHKVRLRLEPMNQYIVVQATTTLQQQAMTKKGLSTNNRAPQVRYEATLPNVWTLEVKYTKDSSYFKSNVYLFTRVFCYFLTVIPQKVIMLEILTTEVNPLIEISRIFHKYLVALISLRELQTFAWSLIPNPRRKINRLIPSDNKGATA